MNVFAIPVLDLFHVVRSSAQMLFVVFHGAPNPGTLALAYEFWLPGLLGNTTGGVVLVALASHAQAETRRYPEIRVLSTRELLFSLKGGRPFETPRLGIQLPGKGEHRETESDTIE